MVGSTHAHTADLEVHLREYFSSPMRWCSYLSCSVRPGVLDQVFQHRCYWQGWINGAVKSIGLSTLFAVDLLGVGACHLPGFEHSL